MMKIKYWTRAWSPTHDLHIHEDTVNGKFVFEEDGVVYNSFGHTYKIAYDKVVSIEMD